MEESIQELMVDLKIISMVQPDGKLYLHSGMLALEPISMWQPIRRFLSNSNRVILSQKIKQRISELEVLLREKQIKQQWMLDEIHRLIEPVKQGICNLQQTYANDSQIQATFSLFLARLENIEQIYYSEPKKAGRGSEGLLGSTPTNNGSSSANENNKGNGGSNKRQH